MSLNQMLQKISNYIKNMNSGIIFAVAGAVIILWQMLLPGYVFSLDMVFGPEFDFVKSAGEFLNALPLEKLLLFADIFLPIWLIQKAILFSLFFLLFYLPFKFFLFERKWGMDYLTSLFYAINPFVYERFLAGHWLFLFGYALLPPVLYFLIKGSGTFPQGLKGSGTFFARLGLEGSRKRYLIPLKLVFCLTIIGIFSLHMLTIAIVLSSIYLFGRIVVVLFQKNLSLFKKILLRTFIAGLVFFFLSSYWTIPYLVSKNSQAVFENFNQAHWQTFQTAGDSKLKVFTNVFSLYGYWGEDEPWAENFVWPKNKLFFLFFLFLILVLIVFGAFSSWQGFILFCFAGLSLVFATGLSDFFSSINLWIFENISFWRGFRDSAKWVAPIALIYAYLIPLGVDFILERVKKIKKEYILAVVFALPLIYTYPMLFGFQGQLRSVWYPKEWQEAKEIIEKDKEDFKILILPWHGYFSLGFNDNLITGNPGRVFFGPKAVSSKNIELGELPSLDPIPDPADFKYIVYFQDIKDIDPYSYSFLTDFKPLFSKKSIILYKQ